MDIEEQPHQDEHAAHRQDYRPEQIPRRGEFVAWVMTLMAFVAWAVLFRMQLPVSPGLKFLAVFLGLAALAISLGNWVDRHTRLRMDNAGISFENGLRTVRLRWSEIQRLEVLPSNWGKRVRVLAGTAHFDFHTLGEVRMQDQIKGRMGFEKGDQILHEILNRANLKLVSGSAEKGSYYARE